MTLTIHRGTHEIGGSCIEITTASTRIFLDFGLPLVDRQGKPLKIDKKTIFNYAKLVANGIAPTVSYFQERDGKPTSLFLTHSHLDHYGLAPWIPSDIPVYASNGTKILLERAYFFGQSTFDPTDVQVIEPWKPVRFGDMTVTPFLADHSAVDAFSYLIEGDSKRVFYSGDIRAHGRKHVLFDNILAKPPANIDYLILEGSMLGRDTSEYETEYDVEKKLCDELSADGLIYASFSSQNIDRFVSFFKACRATKRTLVVDPYTASILDALKELSPNIPQHDWDDSFKVFNVPNSHTDRMANDKSLFRFKSAKITLPEMNASPSRLVIKENYAIRKILKRKSMMKDARCIYSMWDGYLREDNFWEANHVPLTKIHCSGHAYSEDLVRLVDAFNPTKVIPNHTFFPKQFIDLFGDRAMPLQDGQTVDC